MRVPGGQVGVGRDDRLDQRALAIAAGNRGPRVVDDDAEAGGRGEGHRALVVFSRHCCCSASSRDRSRSPTLTWAVTSTAAAAVTRAITCSVTVEPLVSAGTVHVPVAAAYDAAGDGRDERQAGGQRNAAP